MLSNAEYHFTELLSVLNSFVGGARFRQRKNFVNHGMNNFAGDEVEDGKKFRFAAHVRTKNRLVAAEKKTQINLRVVSGGSSAGD